MPISLSTYYPTPPKGESTHRATRSVCVRFAGCSTMEPTRDARRLLSSLLPTTLLPTTLREPFTADSGRRAAVTLRVGDDDDAVGAGGAGWLSLLLCCVAPFAPGALRVVPDGPLPLLPATVTTRLLLVGFVAAHSPQSTPPGCVRGTLRLFAAPLAAPCSRRKEALRLTSSTLGRAGGGDVRETV